ncbi:hypothetical protein EV360DRAFT_24381, partial [Lentinula raphanica]
LHHTSLVKASTHSPALLRIVDIKITRRLVAYVVKFISAAFQHAMDKPPLSPPELAVFSAFVYNALKRAEVAAPEVLVLLVYIERAKPLLRIVSDDWISEKIFLGSLIVATKYLNDDTIYNCDWEVYTEIFKLNEISLIERRFLAALNWDMRVFEGDIMAHHAAFIAAASPLPPSQH